MSPCTWPEGRLQKMPDEGQPDKAGKAAGMFTVAAAYGYIERPESVTGWHADAVIQEPLELRRWFTA